MTKETTPPQETTTHEPPSLPASPLAKRPKQTTSEPAPKDKMGSTGTPAAIPSLQVKKLTPSATAPTRGSTFAAGYDLYSAKEIVIPAKGKALVDTGIAVAVPEGTCTSFPLFSSSSSSTYLFVSRMLMLM